MNHCDFCGTDLIDNRCPSCDLYNAAVSAIQAAAQRIVRNRGGDPKEPCWVNEYGIFGWRDGKCVQMGTPEEAAPFEALTSAARKVTVFWGGR